ncbi:hypothetical protein [Natrinema halophilum]|uniref:Uncharacterized protein n=1 Tax=Natrinema halophilum TaxID=1699371 RepID=A0A7D5KRQ7_9EURY|nr:hypothetical protein [Natrinema halophilum]QLG49577.1 hypothetical protein HYG82_12240 [Natrinema halophilum]
MIDDVGTRTDREFNGRDLTEICADLAETANALMASKGTSLVYRPYEDIPVKHTLGWDDVYGEASVEPDDTEIVNDWRIDGGTGIEDDQINDETNLESYVTVTEDSLLTYQLDTDRNRLTRADLWIRSTGSGEDLTVGVQAPNLEGTGPRDPTDTTKHIVSDRTSAEFLAAGGWRDRFRSTHEPLPHDPWLVITSGGQSGQEIGVDVDGNPIFRTHYPYPINVRVDESESIERYRLRQAREKKTILSSFDAARDVAEANRRHSAYSDETVSCRARSLRAHQFTPGDVVDVSFPEILVEGEHIVIERTGTDDAGRNGLHTELTIQDLATI